MCFLFVGSPSILYFSNFKRNILDDRCLLLLLWCCAIHIYCFTSDQFTADQKGNTVVVAAIL